LCVVGAFLIVIIWLLAFFLPQGKTVSSLKAQETTLEAKVTAGNAKVARLSHTYLHSAQIKAIQSQLNSEVPKESDAYNYVQTMSSAASAAGVHLTSIGISSAPSSGGSTTKNSSGPKVNLIPITMSLTSTYDQLLSLITKIYHLPRLTDINGITISGGGAGTNRTTQLTTTLSLTGFYYGTPPSNA
jgi:Tfp pilus assembly protein PilO